MNITDVRVRKIASTGKLRAYVSITLMMSSWYTISEL